jgi:capsular exopolysaccharide synthesis family protein
MMQTPEMRQRVAAKVNSKGGLPSISIDIVEGTQILQAIVEGEDPQLVANTANTLMEVYAADNQSASTKKLNQTIAFAEKQIGDWEKSRADADAKLKAFRAKNDIVELGVAKSNALGEATSLGQQYQQLTDSLRTLQTRMNATQRQMANLSPTIQNNLSDAQDAALQNIDTQLAQLTTNKEVLDLDFLGSYPTLKRIAREREGLIRRRGELLSSVKTRNLVRNPEYEGYQQEMRRYNIDYATQLDARNSIQPRLVAAKRQLQRVPEWEQQWIALQNQYFTAQQQYNTYAQHLADLKLRQSTQTGGGPRILQRASVPNSPVRPNRVQNILFVGALGLFFGLCLALLQELFDDRINSPEEAERVLRLPSLGLIPLVEEEGLRLIKDISSFSPLMESYRSLRTNINFAAVGSPVRSIVVTSSVPAEGKSTTVANLAMAMALDSKRVIIVDADLRRPSMHKLFKVDSSPGLTDVLVGNCDLDQVIRPTGVDNVSVISAGSPPPNPAELLGSSAMGRLLADLESRCDVVLFDSPPTLAVADSAVLASRTNGVIVVVGYGETKKASTKKAIDSLSRANANILGTVLNRMEGPTAGYYYYGKYYVPVDKAVGTQTMTNGNTNGAMVTAEQKALPQGDTVSSSSDPLDNDNRA